MEASAVTMGLGCGLSLGLALRRSGATALGAWAGSELVRDGIACYQSNDTQNRTKYALGAAVDTVMLAGFASRFFPQTKAYGLAVGTTGFLARWGIEKFL